MPSIHTRAIPIPLEPSLVAAVRAAGWEVVPHGWAKRRLADLDELRRQLERARAAAVPRDPSAGPENDTQDASTVS
jgi:hypothetical protein